MRDRRVKAALKKDLTPSKDLEVNLYAPLWESYKRRLMSQNRSNKSWYLCSFLGQLYSCRRNYASDTVMNSAGPVHLQPEDKMTLLQIGTFKAFNIDKNEGQGYEFMFYMRKSILEEEVDIDFWAWLSEQEEAGEMYGH